jgi:hypothetical protein
MIYPARVIYLSGFSCIPFVLKLNWIPPPGPFARGGVGAGPRKLFPAAVLKESRGTRVVRFAIGLWDVRAWFIYTRVCGAAAATFSFACLCVCACRIYACSRCTICC